MDDPNAGTVECNGFDCDGEIHVEPCDLFYAAIGTDPCATQGCPNLAVRGRDAWPYCGRCVSDRAHELAANRLCKYCVWWRDSKAGKLCVKCGRVFEPWPELETSILATSEAPPKRKRGRKR